MTECDSYNPDNVFKRFKVVEFPISFVGLSTSQYLDVEIDLSKSAFLKTMFEGNLLKFDEAREVSASHRSFIITEVDDHTIQITFYPVNECICNAKRKKQLDNRFVFDLRLIQVDGRRCCNNEFHSEVGRYYISGQYEYCNLSHFPKQINFGDVNINTKRTKYLRIRNGSNLIATKFEYVRVTGYEIVPQKFMIPPNATKRISVTIKPTCMKVADTIYFRVRNPHDLYDDKVLREANADENFISYKVTIKLNVIYNKKSRETVVESLHTLTERDIKFTYINDAEIKVNKQRKDIAINHLQMCKASYAKKPIIERFTTGRVQCYDSVSINTPRLPQVFCKKIRERVNTYGLFDILFLPCVIDFGRIGLNTFGEQELTIKNNTKFDIAIQLYNDECVLYTEEKLSSKSIKMKSSSEAKVTVFCSGFVEGNFNGTFEYFIDNKFSRKHPYRLQVGNPTLMIQEKVLKFGMTSTESFITSVPVRIYNYFNIPVNFQWDELTSDTPFDIIPLTGSVPRHSCMICDVIYICKPTKTKTHEVDFVSQSKPIKIVPVELNVLTRKLAIKFLQPAVLFKDIALNLETIERVKLENSSREIAIFHVLEPLIPGLRIEPMSGTIRPKMIITFEIIVKISCVLEFAFDIFVKINNKENVILPVSGNVVEPKILIHPKNIFMARIPCYMVTYVPVTFQNLSSLKTLIEVLDTGDENIFDVYIAQGNEKQRVFEFYVEGGQTKIVFIKVCDIFRREYEMYIPFKINGLLGPPDQNSWSIELQTYIGEYEQYYESNSKVKIKSVNKDISYCRITGVITVPWISFSVDQFEIEYVQNGRNKIDFTMTNVSKYYLYVTILTAKLAPTFSLNLRTEENQSIINENNIKFELDRGKEAAFSLLFHPKGHGRFVSTALLFLDKHMTIPYYNLTFVGKRQTPIMTPSTYRIIFPPCYVGTEIVRTITIKMGSESDMDSFSCMSKEEPNLAVKLLSSEVYQENGEIFTLLTVELKASCKTSYTRNLTVSFNHDSGSGCDVEINFCFTYCALTLHTHQLVKQEEDPYPYFPLSSQKELYEYLETCKHFLEKWMFQQGFRRDLYPVIPDSFHAISVALSSQPSGTKSKGINVSYLNFVRRIAGPLMKHIRKITVHGVDESFKSVKEIHDTYREIINLMRSRGANLWVLQAKFLLSYDQFVVYSENVTPKCNADILLTRELVEDVNLFNRLTKQSWIDFILQSYKVFVMDSCFFDCVCVSSQHRDIVKVLLDWYNDHIRVQHNKLRAKSKSAKVMTNITTDLSDGIALISTILSYCPFLADQFNIFCEIDGASTKEGVIVNNACLIIEAMNQLRLYFPLSSKDFLQPNFLQMLFLSIHLYVALPMFKPKDIIKFNPPLLRSSSRQVAISPASQESLIFSYIILNNNRNNFVVEKAPSGDNGKRMFLSVKFIANFVSEESCILLVHGYNKTRIFDTYVVFLLQGRVGVLNPVRKCKVTGPLYRPNKVDVLVSSPFTIAAQFSVHLTDTEPSIPVAFDETSKPKFFLKRLNLIDNEISLSGLPKESGQEVQEHKLYLQMVCLSTQVGNTWIWFRSEIGEFFIRITSQPRWDMAIDTLQARVQTWPMDPCSCGEACECYRTTILMIPHRNELMLKSLRYALLEHASEIMMIVFDRLIETSTGKVILGMLLTEGGTNMSDVNHILRSETNFRISSKALLPRLDRVRLNHHTSAILPLPVTIPAQDKAEKYSVTFTSDCGMDIRTYRILFIEVADGPST